MKRTLSVWWDGALVGTLQVNQHGEMRFTYSAEWLADTARPSLSCSLPKRPEPFKQRDCRPFFAGLLPEEAQRDAIARARADGQWQVSTTGGVFAAWRPDGKELFYLDPAGRMMAASIATTATSVDTGQPVTLFSSRIFNGGEDTGPARQYDVAADGRFLINMVVQGPAAPITLIQHWNPGTKK